MDRIVLFAANGSWRYICLQRLRPVIVAVTEFAAQVAPLPNCGHPDIPAGPLCLLAIWGSSRWLASTCTLATWAEQLQEPTVWTHETIDWLQLLTTRRVPCVLLADCIP
jgi:hypothetical protein